MSRAARLALSLAMGLVFAAAAGCSGSAATRAKANEPRFVATRLEPETEQLAFVGHGAGARRIDARGE